jgi:hypothetical protein
MSHVAHYKQPTIWVDRQELIVAGDIYPLEDVLYAEVVDDMGYRVNGFLRDEDWTLLIWVGAAILFVGLLFGIQFPFPAPGFLLCVAIMCGRYILKLLQDAAGTRAQSLLKVHIHTREGTLQVLETNSLLRARHLAAQVNRAAKRWMFS